MRALSRAMRLPSLCMPAAMSSPPPEFQGLNVLSTLVLLYRVRLCLLD
jgi:hypothetical protein